MIKAIIFDFDGVIVDTELKKFNVLKSLLKEKGFILKDSAYKDMIGKKTGFYLRQQFIDISEKDILDISQKRRDLEYNSSMPGLIPGIKELLGYLKSKKLRLAVTSGTKRDMIKRVLEHYDIQGLFDLIIGGEDFKESKASPEGFQVTIKRLGLLPSEVIMIEDSVVGVLSAKNADCKVFAITTSFDKKELNKADKIFSSHKEILNYFKESSLINSN